ncbi:MAG: hypothetical protein ACREQA_18905 [Candidatus Binatia bacterium]
MEPVDEELAWWVRIYWRRWRSIEKVLDDSMDEDAYLYAIWGCFGTSARLLYIGKVYDQYAGFRLTQPDHARRRKTIVRRYPRHRLAVSLGEIVMPYGEKLTRTRVDEVERLLIFANLPELNRQNRETHSVQWDYVIENNGSFGTMYRWLHYGLFGG